MKHEFDVDAQLYSFCDVHAIRAFCKAPYKTHGYMCATNGHFLLMIKDDGKHDWTEDDRGWKPIPDMNMPYLLGRKDIQAVLIDAESKAVTTTMQCLCPECVGVGIVRWRYDYHLCPVCHGRGVVDQEECLPALIDIDGLTFKQAAIHRMFNVMKAADVKHVSFGFNRDFAGVRICDGVYMGFCKCFPDEAMNIVKLRYASHDEALL